MQFGCVFIIFGSHLYHTSIPNTKSRRCRRTRTSEHKLAFVRYAVHFQYTLLYRSRCIEMGLFQLLNSVWLIHRLKSQIAMMKLIGDYFGFNGVSFKLLSSIPKLYPQVFLNRTRVRFRLQLVRFRARWINCPVLLSYLKITARKVIMCVIGV